MAMTASESSKTTELDIESECWRRRSFSAVILDIEGTTTPIAFVAETLFPYVRAHLATHLESTWNSEETQHDIDALRSLSNEDAVRRVEGCVLVLPSEEEQQRSVMNSVVANVVWQMDMDRKSTALKQLQGHVWKRAYESHQIKGV